MCIPLLDAFNSAKAAKTEKQQLEIQAATNAKNSALAKMNAETAITVAKENSDRLLALTAENATARQNITDINVGLATSISNFNQQVADGNGKMLLGRGEIEAAAGERNAATFRLNAANQEQSAQDSLDASHQTEQASNLNYSRLKSTQRASLAANGVALDEGSALRIQTDTDFFKAVDGATIHANGIRAAMGYRQQETNSLIDAEQAQIGANVARINAATEAASVAAQAAGAKMAADRDILNMKLSTSFEILQANENAKINSANFLNEGRVEATNYEMQAEGFSGASDAARVGAKGINPTMIGVSSFINSASQVAAKWLAFA